MNERRDERREAREHEPDEDGYPRPRIPLAANWVQPRRPFNFAKDYMRLPRFRPDFGRQRRRD
jgi:hypothetical protein